MKLNLKVLSFLFLPFLAGCVDESAIKPQIRAVLDSQQEAWNNGDLRGYLDAYWKSDSLVFLSSKKKLVGWDEAFKGYQKSYPDRMAMGRLKFSDIRIRIISADAAHVTGSWDIDREQIDLHGLFSLLLRKKEEGWKIVLDHSS